MKTLILTAAALVSMGCGAASQAAGDPLPDYVPEQKLTGVLRSWGNNHMADVMGLWQKGFSKYHPELRYEDNLKSTAMAQWGLQEWVADMALMGRQIWPYEFYGTYRRSYNFPVEIAVATGSADVPGKSSAFAILVHKDNPIRELTVEQIDRIFGAQRTGGWQGLDWVRDGVARDASTNIRTWGQLGLKGEWANKTIIPYGAPSVVTGAVSTWQTLVHGGADTRNDKFREYQDRAEMVRAMGKDKYSIGYASLAHRTPQVKAIAVAAQAGEPAVALTRESVAARTYPLTRTAYIYFTVDNKTGDLADPLVDPKVKEFLRYVLSRQGQEDVAREGGYLPLTAKLAATQLEKVNDPPTGRVFRKDRR